MMAGAGLDPAPRPLPAVLEGGLEGLDDVLEKLETLAEQHRHRFAVAA